MNNMKKLLDRCKCGVSITINEHKNYYMDAELFIKDDITSRLLSSRCDVTECLPHKAEMIKFDTIIDLQFYPDTPIGSYQIYHYDIELAIEEAVRLLGLEIKKSEGM